MTSVVHRITYNFIFFLYVDLFILDIKGVLLSSEITKSFSSKIPQPLHLHTLTHSLLLQHCSLSGLLSHRTAYLRYLQITVSSLKSLSVHNPCYHERFLNLR